MRGDESVAAMHTAATPTRGARRVSGAPFHRDASREEHEQEEAIASDSYANWLGKSYM